MLDRGYLLGAAVYTTYAYTEAIIEQFLADTDEVFAILSQALAEGSVAGHLRGGIAQLGFKRLTG
jgi:hypothetical protein